jgi:molecular chaperone DnaJ
VPATATVDEIRDAYRARARVHHPDQVGPNGSGTSMAAINEAYRVLRDPTTRSRYDSDLRLRGSAAGASTIARPRASPPPMFTPRPIDTTPARYPWKLVAGMATLGAGVVLVGAALYEPAEPVTPDNVLQPGSCVEVEANNDVREVPCGDADDLVVQTIVSFGEACPTGLAAHRDRQGMGTACVAPSSSEP